MHYGWIFLFTVLPICSIAHVCTDDWELVYLKKGPACWKLLSLPDFSTEYKQAVGMCQAANAHGVEVTNAPEKAIFADLANQVTEPTLTCYKVYQSAVEGHFKSVDYESPPEYLRKVNEEGKVRLEKRIELQDRITIGVSMKVRPGGGKKELTSRIRIGNSTNSARYCINVNCKMHDKVSECGFKHPESSKEQWTQMVSESVEYFAIIVFDFLDNRIRVSDVELPLPKEYSYESMDEITVENMTVTRLEHSKACQGMDVYKFQKQNIFRPMPIRTADTNRMPVIRRSLGSSYTFSVPSYIYDYFRLRAGNDSTDNPWAFDFRMSGEVFNDTQISFWTRNASNSTEIIAGFRFNSTHVLFFTPYVSKIWNFENFQKTEIIDFRITVTSTMEWMHLGARISFYGNVEKLDATKIKSEAIDEIRVFSSKATFFDIQMAPLTEVIMTTCSYRKRDANHMQSTVPFRRECFKKRKILCERVAQDLPNEEIPDEPEKRVWEERRDQTMARTAASDPNVAPGAEDNDEALNTHGDIELENFDAFQWCVVVLTTLSAASFIAIFILNIIKRGL